MGLTSFLIILTLEKATEQVYTFFIFIFENVKKENEGFLRSNILMNQMS